MIKKFALSLAVVGSLGAAGCTQTEQAVGGAVAGGAIGAIAGGTDGALIGAAIGGTAGVLLARLDNGNCRYRDRRGRVYIARCPR